MGAEASATRVLGANFAAGYVAGTIAAAVTCPLDVAKTRRQIQVGHFLYVLAHHSILFMYIYERRYSFSFRIHRRLLERAHGRF